MADAPVTITSGTTPRIKANEVITLKEEVNQIVAQFLERQSERIAINDEGRLNLVRLEIEFLDNLRSIYPGETHLNGVLTQCGYSAKYQKCIIVYMLAVMSSKNGSFE